MTAWYCSACGGPAEPAYPSLDPAHPFGRCTAQPRPCERTLPLTSSTDELAAVIRTNKLAAARRRHSVSHMGPRGRLVIGCTYCYALLEAQRSRAHA